MPSRLSPYVFTPARHRLWIKQGRGTGTGEAYRPWLQTRNVKSQGRKQRMPGILHDRVIHVMSDLERNAIMHFERRADVADIREQFPLDQDTTMQIARSMGVAHPTDPVSRYEIVMTTDLLITFRRQDGTEVVRPVSIKPAAEFLNRRVLEKQEIERRYWVGLGFRPLPLLDTLLRTNDYFETLRAIRACFDMDGESGLDAEAWRMRGVRVMAALNATLRSTVGQFIADVERAGGFGPGEVLTTLKHLIARGDVQFDMTGGVPTPACSLSRFLVSRDALRKAA